MECCLPPLYSVPMNCEFVKRRAYRDTPTYHLGRTLVQNHALENRFLYSCRCFHDFARFISNFDGINCHAGIEIKGCLFTMDGYVDSSIEKVNVKLNI